MAKTLVARLVHKRHKVARRALPVLMREQGQRCHWCGGHIVNVAAIPAERVVHRDADYAYVLDGEGQRQRLLFATVDHVHPLGKGGTNDRRNLVAACAPCNRERNIEDQRPGSPRNCRCRQCRPCERKRVDGYRTCQPCREEHLIRWASMQAAMEAAGVEATT